MPHLLIFEEQKVGSNRTRLFHKLGSSSALLVATDACQTETHPWFYLRQCQQSTDEFPAISSDWLHMHPARMIHAYTIQQHWKSRFLVQSACDDDIPQLLHNFAIFKCFLRMFFFSFANAFKIDYGLKNFLNSPLLSCCSKPYLLSVKYTLIPQSL